MTGVEINYDMHHMIALAANPHCGVFDNLSMNAFVETPQIFLAGNKKDPDTPNFKEATSGPHREDFLAAMGEEIENLQEMKAWVVLERGSLPEGVDILPSTWAFKIKRSLTGDIRKF